MEEQFFDTSDGRIAFYDNRADGLALVMLHANSICKESFALQITAFGNTYRTIAIDLPGHGGSSDATDPRRSYSMTGYANAVSELLAGIGVVGFFSGAKYWSIQRSSWAWSKLPATIR